jgi:acyl-coenzyme A synthetase/AMP-(fatty) acid ligase
VEPAKLHNLLAAVLPRYMIPTRWMTYDVLPKNVNGKIDRKALRENFEAEQPVASQAS